jgi:3-oxoacyl-[acyl-carrier-protein] synthase-3
MTAIEAIGCAFPSRSLTNDELRATFPEWNFERLEKRTGVRRRYVAAEGETALDFAEAACAELARRGSLRPAEIDAVIFCTQSPDYIMPPNACLLHGHLELQPNTLAFDISLACSGYIYGLQLATSLLASGTAKRILLATADTYTRYIHPADRSTRCLFGDGGAVSIISDSPNGHHCKFMIPAGGMRQPRSSETAQETVDESGNVRTQEQIHMDGLGVLSFFNTTVPRAVRAMLARNQLTTDDVDVFLFHQASQVALDSLRAALGIRAEKMIYDLAETGNLVSASIPVALSRALDSGRVRRRQLALLCGFGVGLSWGTALIDL